ncbi:MAG TPA: alkaline phosphatase [Bacteroidales bacterium]|nr:alkaline phosphatase [Bacteroidales bacterium]
MKRISYFVLLVFLLSSCSKNIQSARHERKPKNIILLIGDGMGLPQVYAAMSVKKETLNIEQAQFIGLSKTYSANNYITDSGAGGTAIACGVKTNNGYIGVDPQKKPVKSILEYAEDNGLATGLVVTSSVTHATPASFIAHQYSRYLDEKIAYDFLKTDIDVFIGGGKKFFMDRKDHLNLIDSLKARKYQISYSIDEARNITSGKLACLTADEHNKTFAEGRGEMLVQSTQTALNILSRNSKGFFMMVEGSMIDWGGHANDIDYVTSELIDFDNAVGAALEFARKDGNTLVIVTADHETGGLSLVNDSITHKPIKNFSTKDHSAVMVPVYAFGPGAEKFAGIYQNIAIFEKMFDLYGFKK